MTALLLDTHAWVWSLFAARELGEAPARAIATATTVYVAPCTFYEIAQKHRLGKWPEMGSVVARLPQLLRAQGGQVAPFTAEMAMLSGDMDWDHRDPFDRMIAATAIELACPVLSRDAAFDALDGWPGWCGRVWDAGGAGPDPIRPRTPVPAGK